MSDPQKLGQSTEEKGQSWNQAAVDRLLVSLHAWGADVDEAMERFLWDQPLYLKSLRRLAKEDLSERLYDLVQKRDYEKAYEVAHLFKGSCALLSLDPLTQSLVEVMNSLREGRDPGEQPLRVLEKVYGQFCAQVEEV